MIHGDVVTITSRGILVHDKALQPLGIFDQSMCSAVWAANPFEDNSQYGHPNLIISPIHPSSWPFLLQLEISMSDEEGAFADVCKLLNDSGLSILYIECTTAGFTHAFCNVIAESRKDELNKLREVKSAFDLAHPYVRIPYDKSSNSNNAFKEAQRIANNIAAEMFAHAHELEVDLNSGKHEFLHSWEHEKAKNLFLYDEAVVERAIQEDKKIKLPIPPEDRVSYLKNQFPRTAMVRYMQRLAYFSMYGGGPNVPFSLTYHANSSLLELDQGRKFTPELKIYGKAKGPFPLGEFPLQAVSIFNTQEKYLRLKPVTSEISKNKLTVMDVEYVKDQAEEDMSSPGAMGLFNKIGEKLREHKVNLLHVANKSTRYEYSSKTGLISFVADVPESRYRKLEESIKSITSHPDNQEYVSVERVKAYPYPQWRLFVSIHYGSKREKEIRNIIAAVSKEYGFERIIVESIVKPTTDEVVSSIGRCHAFLQVIPLKGDEVLDTVNFSWLSFEHGVAAGKNLPIVRMVDRLYGTVDKWMQKLNIARDKSLLEFYSNDDVNGLESQIRRAIGELSEELLSRRQASG
jgi:hypothetical protein